MIAKLSTWGQNREQARRRMESALRQCVVLGPRTNIAFLCDLLSHPAFIAGATHTGFLSEHFAQWQSDTAPHLNVAAFAAALNHKQSTQQSSQSVQTFNETLWHQLGGWRIGN
jgi:acetyl/propionyl-CoA carboxylase alpha subunit